MTWLDAYLDPGFVDCLTGLFPLMPSGFVLGLFPWLVSVVVAVAVKALRGFR